MCRLIAIPPMFSKREALDIMLNFEGTNRDGVGFVYVKNNEFVVEKWPKSLSNLIKEETFLLNHLPYNGWTLGHLRHSTHGENTLENTHPHIVKNWAVVHNGVFLEHNIVRLILGNEKFKSQCDSEAAAHLISLIGPEKFSEEISNAGVFLVLNKNGNLCVINTGGRLEIQKLQNKTFLIASDLDYSKYKNCENMHKEGYYFFNKYGFFVRKKEKEIVFKFKKLKTIASITKYKPIVKPYFYDKSYNPYSHIYLG